MQDNKTFSRWRFFNIKENPIHAFLFLCILILTIDIFLFPFYPFLLSTQFSFSEDAHSILQHQPFATNLRGAIGLIYTLLLVIYSVIFYRKNSVFFSEHLIHKGVYFVLAIAVNIYLALWTYISLRFVGSCQWDTLGGCWWGTSFFLFFGLIGCVSIFLYSLFIYRKNTDIFQKEKLETVQHPIYYMLFILFAILIWGISTNVWIRSHVNAVEKEWEQDRTTAAHEANKRQKEMEDFLILFAKNNPDLCPDAPKEFYVSDGTQSPKGLHFPKGFNADIVGYAFLSPENYWDGNLSADPGDKYVVNLGHIDFLKDSMALFPDENSKGFKYFNNKNLKYDLRLALVENPNDMARIRNEQLAFTSVPLFFDSVYQNGPECITVSVQ